MAFPTTRARRLRRTSAIRDLVREHALTPSDFILPLFVQHGSTPETPIEALPGHARVSIDRAAEIGERAVAAGIGGVILFGIPSTKDDAGSEAYDEEGIVPMAIRAMKERTPDLLVMTDVCLCQYTSHGHCGIVRDGKVLNDVTLELLAATATAHARAGADVVSPSDMMDGRVGAIRSSLDSEGFSDVGILAYSVKYSSAFYGPFREAAGSAPSFGDRSSYQMDPANLREAMREAQLDVEEGADMLMVKPAGAYLDVIAALRNRFDQPIAAYQVSGEYAMIKAAAANGWLDERRATLESLLGIKRAGADAILTYAALDAAGWLTEQGV